MRRNELVRHVTDIITGVVFWGVFCAREEMIGVAIACITRACLPGRAVCRPAGVALADEMGALARISCVGAGARWAHVKRGSSTTEVTRRA